MVGVRRAARVNVRALLILLAVVVVLGAGGYVGHTLRARSIARRSLTEGRAALARQEWAQAARSLARYLERNPDDVAALEQYLDALLALPDKDASHVARAAGACKRLARLKPDHPRAFPLLARLLAATGNFRELVDSSRRRVEQHPDDLAARVWLARGLMAVQERERAEPLLREVVERAEPRPESRRDFLDACLLLSNLHVGERSAAAARDALAWLDRAIARHADAGDVLVRRAALVRAMPAANEAEQARLLARARSDLEAAEGGVLDDPRTRLQLAQEWMQHGQVERAAEALEAAERVDAARPADYFVYPQDWAALKFLVQADVAVRRGRAVELLPAAETLLASLSDATRRAIVLPAAVELFAAAERAERAAACVEELARLLGGNPAPGIQEVVDLARAVAEWAAGRPYVVINLLHGYRNSAVQQPRVLKLLAQAYVQTGQSRLAIEAYRAYLRRLAQARGEDREARIQLVREYMKAGQWAAAIELAREENARWSDDLEINLIRAEVEVRGASASRSLAPRVDLDHWRSELARLRETNPRRVDIRVLQAGLAELDGRLDDAVAILVAATAECDDTLPAWLALARLHLLRRQTDEAIRACESARDAHPQRATPRLALAEALDLAGRAVDARAALDAAVRELARPLERRTAAVQLALFELRHDERAAGLELLRGLARESPLDVQLRSLLLSLPEMRRAEVRDEAARLIEEMRAAEGDTGLLWRLHQAALWLGDESQRGVKAAEIRELLRYCIDADPGWPAPVLLLGVLSEGAEGQAELEQLYRRTLAINPGAVEVAERLLDLLERQQRFTDVAQVLRGLEVETPLASDLRIASHLRTGEWDAAIEELKLRAAGDPRDARARILLARLVYQQTRNAPAALDFLREAEQIAGDAPGIALTRALILQADGRHEEGLRILDAQVERHADFNAHLNRAVYLLRGGRPQEAERDFRRLAEFPGVADGPALLADFYLENERVDDAVEVLEQAVRSYADHAFLRRRLMHALLARGGQADPARAADLLAGFDPAQRDADPELMWIAARLKLARRTAEDQRQAETILREIVRREPSFVDAHLALIEIAHARGDVAAARELAISGQGCVPRSRTLLLARARAESAAGNARLALELARSALGEDPRDVRSAAVLAEVALASGGAAALEEARQHLEAARERAPADEQLARALASVLTARDPTAGARGGIELLEAFRRDHPDRLSVDFFMTLADLYQRSGDEAAVLAQLEEADRRAPGDPKVLRARALAHARRGEFDRIAELLRDFQVSSFDDAWAGIVAAGALASTSKPDHQRQALAVLERVVAVAPELTEGRLALAYLAFVTGDARRAEAAYREIVAAQPTHARALNDLAWVLATALDRCEEALTFADRALRLDPDNPHVHDTRGEILLRLPGRLAEARVEFQTCANLSPENSARRAQALLKLVRVCAKLEDGAAVRVHAQEALRIDAQGQFFDPPQRREIEELLKSAGGASGTGVD